MQEAMPAELHTALSPAQEPEWHRGLSEDAHSSDVCAEHEAESEPEVGTAAASAPLPATHAQGRHWQCPACACSCGHTRIQHTVDCIL